MILINVDHHFRLQPVVNGNVKQSNVLYNAKMEIIPKTKSVLDANVMSVVD